MLVVAISVTCFAPVVSAKEGCYSVGKLFYEEHTGRKVQYAELDYILANSMAKVSTTSALYYIVNLETEVTHIVNPNRKTITTLPASKLSHYKLPPLVVLMSNDRLKSYLTQHNAKRISQTPRLTNHSERWTYSNNGYTYNITISPPDASPSTLEIIHKKRNVMIHSSHRGYKPLSSLPKGLFSLPQNYKQVDLRKK